ncbi:MAG: hypothetical protein ACMXYG_03615 [Candidatus Woesearchaeota archaeon]
MALPKKINKTLRLFGFYSGVIVGVLLLLMLFNVPIGQILIIVLMIIIGTISKLYKHFIGISIGFELITPVVIILAYTLNPLFTIIAAIFMVVIAEFISGQIYPNNIIVQIGVYIVIVVSVLLFSRAVDFIPLANSLIIFRNVVLWITMVVPGFVDPFRATIATLPNIFINGFIISTIGVVLIAIL